MRGNWNNNLSWDNSGYWDSDGPISAVGVVVRDCCATEQAATSAVGVLGEASILAETLADGDGLARYYPLWLNAGDAKQADESDAALAALTTRGREISQLDYTPRLDAAGSGPSRASLGGKMCESPEAFRVGRNYQIPLMVERNPPPDPPLGLQWEYDAGFTLSFLFRREPIRREQTLFTISPALRLGVSWLGELALDVLYRNGTSGSMWSTQILPIDELGHIALTYDLHRRLVRVYLDGIEAIQYPLLYDLARITACYFGQWNGASLINGDAQDLRIYHEIQSTDFIRAEVPSYCADWITVVS